MLGKMGIFKRKIELTQYNCNDSNKIAPFKCIIPLRVIIPMNKIPKHFKGFFEETHLDWSFGNTDNCNCKHNLFLHCKVGVNRDVYNLGDAFWYLLQKRATEGGEINPHTISGE